MAMMDTVFLGGTTTGTTWRQKMTELLLDRGVTPSNIFNPHKPKGSGWTEADVRAELDCKNNKRTIILMHICPAVPDVDKYPEGTELRETMSQMLGPLSMFEMGKHLGLTPERVVFVLDGSLFTARRSAKIINIIADDIRETFLQLGIEPRVYKMLEEAADWIAPQLID